MNAPESAEPGCETAALRAEVEELRARLVGLARLLPRNALDLLQMTSSELEALARRPDVLTAFSEAPCTGEADAASELERLWALLSPPEEP